MSKNSVYFRELERKLGKKYPVEYYYCSLMSLYSVALKAGDVTIEDYESARKFHDTMWDYVGD